MICGRLDSAKQLDSLQLQLHVIAEQRDSALLQLSSAQETISSYATSLSNLQMVLEQFQAGETADNLCYLCSQNVSHNIFSGSNRAYYAITGGLSRCVDD